MTTDDIVISQIQDKVRWYRQDKYSHYGDDNDLYRRLDQVVKDVEALLDIIKRMKLDLEDAKYLERMRSR